MIKSSLIDAFKTFTPQEMKEFSEFISSPFFNKNMNVIRLFEVIRKNYPDFEADKIEKEKVFRKLFPGKQYKDSTMRLVMFYLVEVVEKFIAYNRFTNDTILYAENLLEEQLERGLYKEFEKNIEKINKEIEKTPFKNEDYYENRFIFKNLYLDYISNFVGGKYEKYIGKEDIEFVSNNLTYYYLIRIFKFYSVTLNTMNLYNIKIDTAQFENVIKNLYEESHTEVPLINIYFNAVMALLKPEDEKYYYKLKELVFANENILDTNTLSDIYINLENYCHRKGRTGVTKFNKESIEIYKRELDSKVCFSNGIMPDAFYKSFAVTACTLEEFDVAREFIQKYKNTLKENSREALYYFALSFLEGELKNYGEALKHLAKIKAEDVYLKMDIRSLQSRIYYSLVWTLPLQSLLDTFKKTVQNNKLIPETRKNMYLSFIKYINQLNNIREKKDFKGIKQLKESLENEEYFPYKLWLIGKAEELILEQL